MNLQEALRIFKESQEEGITYQPQLAEAINTVLDFHLGTVPSGLVRITWKQGPISIAFDTSAALLAYAVPPENNLTQLNFHTCRAAQAYELAAAVVGTYRQRKMWGHFTQAITDARLGRLQQTNDPQLDSIIGPTVEEDDND